MSAPRSEYFFEFGDDLGEENFIAWHHARHLKYDSVLAKAGTTLPQLDLTGTIDGDWFLRHGIRHSTLRKIAGTVTRNSTAGLKTVNWRNKVQVNDWLRIHAIDHQNLDQHFGLT
jgi:hypothetical protein